MNPTSILVSILIVAGVCSCGRITTAQESGRDAIYSRFEDYDAATSQDKIRERLDALAQHLKSNPPLRAMLISYGGQVSCRDEALLRARLATRYLADVHGIPPNRFSIHNGGYRKYWVVELWIGSVGATAPQPAKTIKSRTVRIGGKCKLKPIRDSQ